jgi:arabinogalactan endo-1,4-beta-galactosidase
VGNEINGGMAGVARTSTANYNALLKEGCRAVREVDPNILIAIHYANPERKTYQGFATSLKNGGVEYDVFASSYYPHWHGTLENLVTELTTIANMGYKVMVAENAFPWTNEEGDGQGNVLKGPSANPYFPVSVQGQANQIVAILKR